MSNKPVPRGNRIRKETICVSICSTSLFVEGFENITIWAVIGDVWEVFL